MTISFEAAHNAGSRLIIHSVPVANQWS